MTEMLQCPVPVVVIKITKFLQQTRACVKQISIAKVSILSFPDIAAHCIGGTVYIVFIPSFNPDLGPNSLQRLLQASR